MRMDTLTWMAPVLDMLIASTFPMISVAIQQVTEYIVRAQQVNKKRGIAWHS